MPTNTAMQDSDDLEELFDSIVAANAAEASPTAAIVASMIPTAKPATPPVNAGNVTNLGKDNEDDSTKVINQIGQMARTLHDSLRELGLNKEIEKAAASIPDARDRLNYVATLTQQAAEKVLNATDAAQPLLEKMEVEAHRLAGQWQMLFDKKLDVEQFKNLVMHTHTFLYEVPKQTKETNAYLLEIMMAQDFQDLTGQVIKKIIAVTQDMEKQLLELLVDNAPPSVKAEIESGHLLNGPVINPNGRTDVVTNQDQVDDLLESLGF
jgi:chemotaxis protein CheZ